MSSYAEQTAARLFVSNDPELLAIVRKAQEQWSAKIEAMMVTALIGCAPPYPATVKSCGCRGVVHVCNTVN